MKIFSKIAGVYKKDCVYYLHGRCRLPDRKRCFLCSSFRKPIEGLNLSQHVQLDENRRTRVISITSLTVAILAFLVNFAKAIIDIFK